MALLILSPIAIVILVIGALNAVSTYTANEHEIQELMQSAESEVEQRRHHERIDVNEKGATSNSNSNSNIRSPQHKAQTGSDSSAAISQPTDDILVLTTKHGKIRVTLRPDLSAGSVDYVHTLVNSGICNRCNLYRAEKPGILQGVMANPEIATNTQRGDCPQGSEDVHNDCPAWDANCGCHGPVMTKGAVAWAAGQAGGPDFFIDNYPSPAKWWGTQHTNFGFVQDDESFRVIDAIFGLPIKKQGMMTMLETPVHFDLSLETSGDAMERV